ncbi:hypothetical protein LINPERHAP1_LOCUS20241 [Linum perenne]
MDSVASISPSMVLPPTNLLTVRRPGLLSSFSCSSSSSHSHRRQLLLPRLSYSSDSNSSFRYRRRGRRTYGVVNAGGVGGGGDDDPDEELERALHLDGTIPGTSDEFVKQVSSRAYDMRRNLQQTFDSSSYDVLESNPWRETSKPVYVLTHRDNQLCTMKTRRTRRCSEVESELGMLFSKGGKRRPDMTNQAKKPKAGTKFQMLVEDIREGVLLPTLGLLPTPLQVFDLCRKMRGLAVLFRRGRTPPLPQSLELNLKARKRSLEDQEDAP